MYFESTLHKISVHSPSEELHTVLNPEAVTAMQVEWHLEPDDFQGKISSEKWWWKAALVQ